MLLVTDIGNTNIVFGGIQEDRICFQARIATDREKSSDQYAMTILKLLAVYGVERSEIEDAIISSVVPPVLNAVRTGLAKILGIRPMVVGPGLKTGLNIQVENPAQVGSDRIVAAVGALIDYEAPLILLDMGTATTIEVVGRGNTYLGGCIIPGVRTALDGLVSHSAQLPSISLEPPKAAIGTNTIECLRSGVLCGNAAMIDGMLTRIEEELGETATILATGGIAPLVVPLCHREIHLEEDLLLKGLSLLYRKNCRKKQKSANKE